MSLPSPSGDMPLASAAPSPPLDPPVVRCGCHGLWVTPCNELSVVTRSPRSGKFVRPIGIAPAARMRSTTGASVDEGPQGYTAMMRVRFRHESGWTGERWIPTAPDGLPGAIYDCQSNGTAICMKSCMGRWMRMEISARTNVERIVDSYANRRT